MTGMQVDAFTLFCPREEILPPLLAELAVEALLAELELTPKPALVDRRGSGAHSDLTLSRMYRSAYSLRPMFAAIAKIAHGQVPSQSLREQLAVVGRRGEQMMLVATDGSNTHRGAIWSIGLLVAGVAMSGSYTSSRKIAAQAAATADGCRTATAKAMSAAPTAEMTASAMLGSSYGGSCHRCQAERRAGRYCDKLLTHWVSSCLRYIL